MEVSGAYSEFFLKISNGMEIFKKKCPMEIFWKLSENFPIFRETFRNRKVENFPQDHPASIIARSLMTSKLLRRSHGFPRSFIKTLTK